MEEEEEERFLTSLRSTSLAIQSVANKVVQTMTDSKARSRTEVVVEVMVCAQFRAVLATQDDLLSAVFELPRVLLSVIRVAQRSDR